jgi:peptidoglycan hydrolase-like protein with peptidoglycan-binding domain
MATPWIAAGTYGAEVAKIQTALQAAGFDIPRSESTRGFFGAETANAVRRFQQQSHLPVTGIVDDLTLRALAALSPTARAPAGVARTVSGEDPTLPPATEPHQR